jgi:TPR repeat protein
MRLAAEQGIPQAQFDFGLYHLRGIGVAKDDTKAVYWFRRAAVNGSASGQHSLGIMFDQGNGVARDPEEALRWYARAALQGHRGSSSMVRALEEETTRTRSD